MIRSHSQRGERAPSALRRGGTWMTLLGVLAAVGVVATAGYYYLPRKTQSAKNAPITQVVIRGPFLYDVVEKGEVESSRNIEVRCEVKSRNTSGTAILDVVPEGSRVEAGDVLVRLDSSALENERVQQQIVCNNKEATVTQARNLYEAALIARKEYLEGTYQQEEQLILSELFVAEENLRRAQQYASYSERLAAKGYVTALQLEGDRFAVEKAQKELETARTKLKVLQEYTKEKMLKQFDSDIKIAEAQWKSEQGSYDLELSRLKEVEEQIEKCVIRAPQAGQVVYANQRSSRSSTPEFVVEPGAMIRERQTIIRLPDSSEMQVKALINESRISLIRTGLRSNVTIDAFEDSNLEGEVVRVNEYPEPTSFFSSSVKQYVTLVKIKNPPPGLRPGLTAKVRIHVSHIDDALQVPVQAIFEHGAKYYCLVKTGDRWEPREVQIGTSNEKFVVINQGLTAAETVALDPRPQLEHIDLPELPAETPARQSAAQIASNTDSPAPAPSAAASPSDAPPGPALGQGPPGTPRGGGRGFGGSGSDGSPPSPEQIVAGMFSRMDTNGDGEISGDELSGDTQGRLVGADANGDGKIDRAELTAHIGKRMASGRPPGGVPGAAEE